MLNLIFKKINKSDYPKIARKWSFSVLLVFPVFVIANKLWPFLYLWLILNLINVVLIIFKAPAAAIDIVSFIIYIVIFFCSFFLVLYGRILAWQKLGYENNEKDLAKFKLRQRMAAYVNILIIGSIIISIIHLLNLARIYAVYG